MRLFKDRNEAGRVLAEALKKKLGRSGNAVVAALPRGGVVVGREVADALGLPLDIVVPRKIGAPDDPEFAIGALPEEGEPVWDEKERARHRAEELSRIVEKERAEAARRLSLYRAGRQPRDLAGKTVIVVDDGIATGLTMRAALRTVRSAGAKRVIAAVPVAPPLAVEMLRTEADEWVVPEKPFLFGAIGAFYENFDQVSDEEVIELLKEKT